MCIVFMESTNHWLRIQRKGIILTSSGWEDISTISRARAATCQCWCYTCSVAHWVGARGTCSVLFLDLYLAPIYVLDRSNLVRLR